MPHLPPRRAAIVLPEGMPPGLYALQVRDDPRAVSEIAWIAVGEQSATRAAVPSDQHQSAVLILPGQTITGDRCQVRS